MHLPVPRLIFTAATTLALFVGPLPAAPDDHPSTARGFTAAEMAQGYTERSVLALPLNEEADGALAAAEAAEGFTVARRFDRIGNLRELIVPAGETVASARARLEATGRYKFVEFDQLRQTALTPNDPSYVSGAQWHLNNNGIGGIAGADIAAPAGWDIRSDASTIIVAVIDSGLRLTHRDIVANLWSNPGEIAGNGVDDNGDFYVDDVHGINAREPGGAPAGNPTDDGESGHGTHVAGIIGAVANNGLGVAGVAWRVKLMPLKFLGGENGTGATSDAIECINYAISHGAHVINASYGAVVDEQSFSQAEFEALRRAGNAGIIVVAAAGNDALNLDIDRNYPASFPLDNIVTVGNSTRLDDRSPTSNTGSGAVDLFAPGTDILSLGHLADDATTTKSGTSMAAPIVSGIVALLRAQYPQDDYRQIINRLLRGTVARPDFAGRAQTGGRASLFGALTASTNRPFNDDFAQRAQLRGDTVAARGSNRHATAEPGEPSPLGVGGPSLWFAWTATTSGTVTVTTTNSAVDTRLAVYTGTELGALVTVASNDNAASGQLTSRLTFDAVAGTTYPICVTSPAASTGLIMLNLSAAAANDAFAAGQPLDGDAPVITAANSVATRQSGEPTHAGVGRGRSLWYRWTAPGAGLYQVSAYSLTIDPVVAVYTGNAVNSLTAVASANNSGPGNINPTATASFNAVAGTTYHIAVDSASSATGEFTLSLTDAAWQFTTGSSDEARPTVTNSPAVGRDGTLYVGSSDGYFYAISSTGAQRWRFQTGGIIDTSAAAIAADGTILFGATDGVAYALHPDGTVRWQSAAIGSYYAPPALAIDGTSYFKNDDGNLRAFAPDGTVTWTYAAAGDSTYGGPTVAPDGTVYLPGNDGALHALGAGGELIWKRFPPGPSGNDTSGIYTSPSLDAAGNLYAATLNGTVFSLTPSGDIRWSYRTPGIGENVTSSLALAEGRVYFASYGALLYALDQANGTVIWTASIEAQARASSPAVAADGSIFVGSYANKLYRFSRAGDRVRTWSAGNWFRSSPVLANGLLYIGNGDGKLYAFDLAGVGPATTAIAAWPQHRFSPARVGRRTIDVRGNVVAPNPADPGRLVNLSVRNQTRQGEGALIAGFVLGGSTTKPLVVRGIGPALTAFGVADAIPATNLRLFTSADSNNPVASNQGWSSATGDGSDVGGFALTPGSGDSVLRPTLGAGTYTAQAVPLTTTASGSALIEIYDAARAQLEPPLVNLSARTQLAANGDVIAGFVLGGTTPRSVLIRAVGPGLVPFGVSAALGNPKLSLFSGTQAVLANDDWAGAPRLIELAQSAGAFTLDNASADAVLTATLAPGAYTARVTGAAGQSGVVLIEVYLLNN